MHKRYQVFVSSTYTDLQEERTEVIQALLELDCIPAGMEMFPASNEDQWTLIKRVIDDCDYYLLIIGGRYGSLNEKGISYTEMEFDYALSTGKPIISFLHKEPGKISVDKSEPSEDGRVKLEAFRKNAEKKMVKYWEDSKDLGSVVSRSMVKLIKNFPAVGWVKSDTVVSSEETTRELLRLQKENKELREQIEKTATQAPKGSEFLEQGDDLIEINFKFVASNSNYDSYSCKDSLIYEWDEIFEFISPKMIDECSIYTFERKIIDMLEKDSAIIRAKPNFANFKNFNNYAIADESVNIIKVQFKALGLIKLSEKKRSTKDLGEYWTLTEYGEYKMTQLLARKKEYPIG